GITQEGVVRFVSECRQSLDFGAEGAAMTDAATLIELNRRIDAIRDNIRQLIEQAAAYSGAADEARAADRIAEQEAKLAELLQERDALAD
ncbi:MAG: hypothetical protein ACREC3_08010, partial [Methyloceanibacter sp.]